MNSLSHAMRVSASGMHAERFRMDIISSNIANANTVGTENNPGYARRIVELAGGANGVRVTGVRTDPTAPRKEHEPSNPLADREGNVYYSNVDPIKEMVNMLSAGRAYEANIAAFNSTKGMIRNAMQIGKI